MSLRLNHVTFSQVYNVHAVEGAAQGFDVQVVDVGTERAVSLRQPDAALGKVVENYILTSNSVNEKRHIGTECYLLPGCSLTCQYRTGVAGWDDILGG
jgi:hypothetical protein